MMALRRGEVAWGWSLVGAILLGALAGRGHSGEEAGAKREERDVDLGGGVKMAFVLIPPGTFTMGSTEAEIKAVLEKWPDAKEEWFGDEKPAHKVSISKAFWMGKHEATVGQFRRFVEAAGYKTHAEKGPADQVGIVLADGKLIIPHDPSWRKPYLRQTDEHPVVCVNWHDAQAFAQWLNATDRDKPGGWTYRLPTEAEWEYACRAGTTTWYQWGDNPDDGKGWCNAARLTGKQTTAPVGSLKASAFGVHDMHGNVWEWCQDRYGPYKEGDQTDPAGPADAQDRVIRGGSWGSSPRELQSAFRGRVPPGCVIVQQAGFRLVLAPGP